MYVQVYVCRLKGTVHVMYEHNPCNPLSILGKYS